MFTSIAAADDELKVRVRQQYWFMDQLLPHPWKGATVKYKFKRRPYAHQKDAIRKLVSTGYGGALLMAPRTGKTKTLIDYACIMHEAGKVNRVLIVCPVAVLSVWEDELAANVPDRISYTLTVWDKDARKDTPLPKWGRDSLDFVVINHDAFSTAGKITGRDKHGNIKRSRKLGGRYDMKRAFRNWQPQLMAIDESHRMKSPSAAKTRTMTALAWDHKGNCLIPYRVLMTGTPITKKKRIFDIYAQWKFLNPQRFRGMTFDDFKHHYARWLKKEGYEMWISNRPKEVEELKRQIHKDSFAVTRDECFDLPKMTHQVVRLELTGETALAYDEMATDMVARLKSGEIIEASIKLVMTMRLSQLSSGVGKTTEDKLVRLGTDKLDVLESILSDLFEADEKVVIAARWSADIAAVQDLCRRLKTPCWVLQGRRKGPDQDRASRGKALADFKNLDTAGCFVVQPQSGSMGIDLSTASTLVWFSLTSSWVDYTQMNDRIALNPHSVSIIYLVASPADQLLFDTLQEDGDVATEVTASPDRLLRNYKN